MERELFWILNRAGDFRLLDWVVGSLPAPVFTVVLALVLWRAAPGKLWLKLGTGRAGCLPLRSRLVRKRRSVSASRLDHGYDCKEQAISGRYSPVALYDLTCAAKHSPNV